MQVASLADNFLDEQTAGSIIRNSFRIYFRYFRPLWLTGILFLTPGYVLQLRAQSPELALLSLVVSLVGGSMAYIPMTSMVSAACLGHKVSLRSGLRASFTRASWSVMLATLLLLVCLFAGLLLLVVPGLIWYSWFLVAPIIAAVERTGVLESFKRSRQLGRGSYLRNMGVSFIAFVVPYLLVSMTIGTIFGVLLVLTSGIDLASPDVPSNFLAELVAGALLSGTAPLFFIPTILVYYDMRVRKEGFDVMRLVEDLRI